MVMLALNILATIFFMVLGVHYFIIREAGFLITCIMVAFMNCLYVLDYLRKYFLNKGGIK